MVDYHPLHYPATQLTATASATITAGQLLYVSGNNTVAPTTAATAAWVGVAAHDAASGELVSYYRVGVHELAASGAIAAGATVIPAAAGAVADQGTPSAANAVQVVGIAQSAAASGKVRVALR